MPLLGKLLTGLITLLVSIFGRFMVLEKAFKLASIITMVALASGLFAALNSCVMGACGAGLSAISSSHRSFAVGLGMVFNSVTYTAASCYMSVWTLCQIYILRKKMIEIF